MKFQFFAPTVLFAGRGRLADLEELAPAYGKKPFVIAGDSALRSMSLKRVMQMLYKRGLPALQHIKPPGEPDTDMVDQALAEARIGGCDMVISFGGGSVIDLAKAVAALVTNGGSVKDYLEGVGEGKQVLRPTLPHIAIPTTAGTGAEVTRNAVISSRAGKFKKSMRSPYLCPATSILDAELTVDLPPQQTAFSGMDAITQLIEAFLTHKASPVTDSLALLGLEMALPAIREAYHNPQNIDAREKMLTASTISGICLANAGLGLAHGFASGLGALYDVPHGKACAILLPHALRINRAQCQAKIARVGKLLSNGQNGTESALADLALSAIDDLNRELGIPPDLKELHIPENDFQQLAKMSMGNSMSGNPVEISQDRAVEILHELA